MFFLGILAFLQITCLPGILLIKAFKIKGSLIQMALFCHFLFFEQAGV